MTTEQVTDELKLFLEKHGKQLKEKPINAAAEHNAKVQERMNQVFYQQNDPAMAELVDEDDQDLLMNDDEDEDMLFQNEPEDQVAVMPPPPKQQFQAAANKKPVQS